MDISATTKAVLLLTAPLRSSGRTEIGLPLALAEYTRLADRLVQLDRRPEDLLGGDAAAIIDAVADVCDPSRLRSLLARGMQLAFAVDEWRKRAIQVVGRADPAYPDSLKRALAQASPPVLYVCGNPELLNAGGLAVVGSRNAPPDLLAYADAQGALAAAANAVLVSGSARGVDQAAMDGAAAAGGRVVGVVPHGLADTALRRVHRAALMDSKLVLCSPYDPNTPFTSWQAHGRNKVIYALADAALVVQAEVSKGGTWRGAEEQIRELRTVPVYVRTAGQPSAGLRALRDRGAQPWPEPRDAEALTQVLRRKLTPSMVERPLFDERPAGRSGW